MAQNANANVRTLIGAGKLMCFAPLPRNRLNPDRRPVPIEIGPDIRAPRAAGLAGEARLDVGQPGIIRPAVAADRGPMAAMVVRAIDQQPANAARAHFSEGDLLAGRFGHEIPVSRQLDKINVSGV